MLVAVVVTVAVAVTVVVGGGVVSLEGQQVHNYGEQLHQLLS